MGSKKTDSMDTIWPISPHTAAKHDLLRNYLGAWFAIFGQSSNHDKVNFIDGFAGPGVYADGEEGSPIVSLRALLEHSAVDNFAGTQFNFIFNEHDGQRLDALKTMVERLRYELGEFPPNVKLRFENQNFNDLGEDILGSMQKSEVLAPTFFFVDPFGYKDVPLELMQKLLAYRACEMLIYFDFNSVNRFATAGNVDEHFEALFGTKAFTEAPASGPARHEYLRDLYEQQLRDVGRFTYVRSFAMVRGTGHVGYYLFFCTRDLQAFDKMKAQMWKLDPSGSYRFEDRLADALVLFEASGSTEPLKEWLLERFAGKTVPIQVVIDTIIGETPYYSGQVKTKTLAPMNRAGVIGGANQKTIGQFPAGSSVVFP